MQQTPSIGRIVHFVMDDGRYVGEERPAIITRVWSDTCVQLAVFIDGTNDYPNLPNNGYFVPCTQWKTSRSIDEHHAIGTWHWPEFVPPKG